MGEDGVFGTDVVEELFEVELFGVEEAHGKGEAGGSNQSVLEIGWY